MRRFSLQPKLSGSSSYGSVRTDIAGIVNGNSNEKFLRRLGMPSKGHSSPHSTIIG